MRMRRIVAGTCIAITLGMSAATLMGQEKKAKEKTRTDSKEIVLKGTLTGLEQEVIHSLRLKKDQAYTLSMDSRGFFAEVQIDDGRGQKMASLGGSGTFTAADDDQFLLRVSSPGGSSGQYVLTVRPVTLTPNKPGEIHAVGPDGLTMDGVLTKNDPLDKVRKKHCRLYDVKMDGGKTYVIDLISKQFDAFLRLENATGAQLAQDDDSGGGNNARIRFKANQDGVYRVVATTFGVETGSFILRINEEAMGKK